MRRATWPPPIHRHASGQARVRVKGVDYYLGPYGSEEAKAAYAKLIAELARQLKAPPPSFKNKIEVGEIVARFLAHADRAYDQRGREPTHFRLSLAPLVRLYERLPAAEFGVAELKAVQRSMGTGDWMDDAEKDAMRARGKPVGWSRRVVNRRLVRVRTVWRWAEQEGLVPTGSYAHLLTLDLKKRVPGVRELPRREASSEEDLEAVCRYATRPVAAMLRLQFWSGMRPGDVRIMRTRDIDMSGDVWLYRPESHKMQHRDQTRIVALGPKCQQVLAPWLRPDKPDAYLFCPVKRHRQYRTYYASDVYTQAVARACKRAGVKLVAYQGRHAAKARVTRALGLDAARALLGQKSLGSTDQYATQIDLAHAIDAARRLG